MDPCPDLAFSAATSDGDDDGLFPVAVTVAEDTLLLLLVVVVELSRLQPAGTVLAVMVGRFHHSHWQLPSLHSHFCHSCCYIC